MCHRILLLSSIIIISCNLSYSEQIKIFNVNVKKETTELGGPRIVIEYDINEPGISQDTPVYVFIRYSEDSGATWKLLPIDYLRGNGHDLISSPGHKRSVWWGIYETDSAAAHYRFPQPTNPGNPSKGKRIDPVFSKTAQSMGGYRYAKVRQDLFPVPADA